MTATFALPDLGEGLTDAEVVRWRVAVGDAVEIDQVVVEVETAKALVEVPCPFAGRVAVLHAEPGESVPVGRPLLTVAGTDEVAADAGSGQVLVGYGTSTPARRRRGHRRMVTAQPASAVERLAPRFVSPIVRRLAAERGLDAGQLCGTGPGGVIRRRDVEAATAATPSSPAALPPAGVDDDEEERIPLRGVRRAIADKLVRSLRDVPDVTVWVDADATGLLEARDAVRAAYPERPVGVLALVARIVVHALSRFPDLNSRVDGDEIVRFRAVHLGVAAHTDRGLVVPVVRDASAMSLLDLADALAATTRDARAGNLPPGRLTGGTFTLNNYGVFGVDGSTPRLNVPEAALLGLGRIARKPWVVDDRLEVRSVTQLSLTFDHRVCDGGVAGGFLRYVADCVERPAVLLASL